MLHAIEKNKTKIFRRYTNNREDDTRVPQEDEITSTIFGSLSFIADQDAFKFWKRLLPDAFNDKKELEKIKYEFWLRKDGVEPDAYLTFTFRSKQNESRDNDTVNIIIEIKWNAKFSGKDQLTKQWKVFAKQKEQQTYHVFIAKNLNEALSLKNKSNDCRLIPIRWLELRKIFQGLLEEKEEKLSRQLRNWAKLSDSFLEKAGINAFLGFKAIFPTTPPTKCIFLECFYNKGKQNNEQ